MANIKVLHIPEQCVFNDFIIRTEQIQEKVGISVFTPKICLDGISGSNYNFHIIEQLPLQDRKNLIVHLHWPEKMYVKMSPSIFYESVLALKSQGIHFVKTIHNLLPHEVDQEQKDVESKLLKEMDGLLFFSDFQRKIFLSKNSNYHGIINVIPHPNYIIRKRHEHLLRNDRMWNMLCIGRIRAYKHIHALINVLKDIQDTNLKIYIAGKPDDRNTILAIENYACFDKRLQYEFGFLDSIYMEDLIYKSDAVLLTCPNIWSSGVAILAANMKKPLIGKLPMMLKDYVAEEIGVFDAGEFDMSEKKLSLLVKKAMDLGKLELNKRAKYLHDCMNANSDEKIGMLYYDFYDRILN